MGPTFKLLNSVGHKTYGKTQPSLNEKALISVFRCLNLSFDSKFNERANLVFKSKNFWKLLFPQSMKDERKPKMSWMRAGSSSSIPKLSRGFNGTASLPAPSNTGRTAGRKPPRTDHDNEARMDRGDISDQKYYTKEYVPNRRLSLKRQQEEEEEEENVFRPPPPHKCRLSCSLPPSDFLPPEKTPYIPKFQPPCVRFPTLQSEFLPRQKLTKRRPEEKKPDGMTEGKPESKTERKVEGKAVKEGKNTEGNVQEKLEKVEKLERVEKIQEKVERKTEEKPGKYPDGKLEKRAEGKVEKKEVEAEAGRERQAATPAKKPVNSPPIDFPEFMPNSVKSRKNYLNLKTAKSQMYGPHVDVEPKMKALLFEPTNLALNYDTVNAPTRIFKDEILVQVAFSGVCGFDLFITEGRVCCGHHSIILGHEISGKVYAVGSAVTHVKPGDNVAVDAYTGCSSCSYCSRGLPFACSHEGLQNCIGVTKNGGWAEFVVVNKSQVHKVPEGLGLDQAALTLPLSCILSAMSKLKLSYGMQILIQGLGLTGSLWATVLHARGFKNVMVSDKNERRKTQFESLNLSYAFVPPEDIRKHLADVVIECTGSPTSIEKSFNVLNPSGQICLFGKPSPVTEIRCLPYEIIQKEITIVGNAGNAFCFSEAINVANFMGRRYLDLEKLGVRAFELEEFKEAFHLKKTGEISKIVFKFDS